MDEKIQYKGLSITDAERIKTKDFGDKTGKFTVKIPLPYERTQIAAATSRSLGGAPLNSIQATDYEYARMITTLNYVIQDSPGWWNGAESCPDNDFLYELWKFFLDVEEKFFEYLKKNS